MDLGGACTCWRWWRTLHRRCEGLGGPGGGMHAAGGGGHAPQEGRVRCSARVCARSVCIHGQHAQRLHTWAVRALTWCRDHSPRAVTWFSSCSHMVQGPLSSCSHMVQGPLSSCSHMVQGPLSSCSHMVQGPLFSCSHMVQGPLSSRSHMVQGPLSSRTSCLRALPASVHSLPPLLLFPHEVDSICGAFSRLGV